jgi:hypothetical protein
MFVLYKNLIFNNKIFAVQKKKRYISTTKKTIHRKEEKTNPHDKKIK